MAETAARRRLAAIVAADVVGYSRLLAADEAGTLAAMKAHRGELWLPEVAARDGRVFGTAGDSILVELQSAVAAGTARVVANSGRITGYAGDIAFFAHAVGESNTDLQALIAATKIFGGPGFLLPTRNAELFRWCLGHGLHVVQQMTLMSVGLYSEPRGVWLPSVLY